MSSQRIAKNLAVSLTKQGGTTFGFRKGLAYRMPSKFFIEGVLIQSSRYKQAYYAWNLLCPLWGRRSYPILNYSFKLGSGKLFEGEPDKVSDLIIQSLKINRVVIEHLQNGEIAPRDFLKKSFHQYDWRTQTLLPILFDFAILSALDANFTVADKVLERYLHATERKSEQDTMREEAQQIRVLLQSDQNHVTTKIAQMAARGVKDIMGT